MNAFELCGPANHEVAPDGEPAWGDDSNWTRAQVVFPDLEPPSAAGSAISNDFSRLKSLGGLLRTYTFYSWE